MTLTVRAVLPAYALTRPVSGLTTRAVRGYALVNPNPITPRPPVTTDYRKPQSTLIYDLIEKSNPGFKEVYPLGSVTFSSMTAITVDKNDPYQNDTSILVTPTAASGGLGKVTVKYRKIDLTSLLKGINLLMTDWYASTQIPAANWQANFVAKFGISVDAADWTYTGAVNSGTPVSTTIKATSLCYKGTVLISWTRQVQPLGSMLTDANRALVGRLYPGGNDFTTPGRKPTGELQLYAQDASAIGATINAYAAVSNVPVGETAAIVLTLIDWLNANTGRTNWSTSASTVDGGIGGLTWYKYTLPNAAIPDANSAKFNRCLVIQGIAGSWFSGKLILHFNV